MSYTEDPTTVQGKIRLRIADRNPSNPIFQDEDLLTFYTDEGSSVKRACAAALEAIAINEALVQKVIKNLALSTDGAKLADQLLKSADRYRAQAEEDEATEADTWDVIEQAVDHFTTREIRHNSRLRGV